MLPLGIHALPTPHVGTVTIGTAKGPHSKACRLKGTSDWIDALKKSNRKMVLVIIWPWSTVDGQNPAPPGMVKTL